VAQWIATLTLQFVPVLHAAGDRSMTLFCGWTKKFSFGIAVLACGHSAMAGGPFKPASYGKIVEDSTSAPESQYSMAAYGGEAYGVPMGGYESYPGQYAEPSTMGEYVQGCDTGGGGCAACGGMGCGLCSGMMGQPFGGGLGMGGAGGDGETCGYCGTPGCTLGGRCIGTGRSVGYFLHSALHKSFNFACNLTPYGEGGVATQRWFDISAEMIALKRNTDAANFNLTSQGIAGPIVLSTGQLSQDRLEPGLMLQANLQVGPGSNLELVYFGLNKWSESATATSSTPTLFSYISDFGTAPFGGFDDTDRSFLQSATYSSAIHNTELNFRRRWQEPAGYFQGSFLAGVRYFDLDEKLLYSTRGENNDGTNNGLRFADFDTQTRNTLVGFQLGGDLWWNLLPGVKLGTEFKTGVYGNHSEQGTFLRSNSIDLLGNNTVNLSQSENASDGRTAYLTSFNTQLWYRLSYSWAFKTSFQAIYIDNVALAGENVNSVPLALSVARQQAVRVNNDGEVMYTGFTLGAEYTW
jgi:hypothetical protein